MTHRTSDPPKRTPSKAIPRSTRTPRPADTGAQRPPLTKLRTIDETAEISRQRRRPAAEQGAMITAAARVRPISKLRTIGETAELLNVSTRTVRRAIESGALPVHRLGRSVRISEPDIRVFLADNRSV